MVKLSSDLVKAHLLHFLKLEAEAGPLGPLGPKGPLGGGWGGEGRVGRGGDGGGGARSGSERAASAHKN